MTTNVPPPSPLSYEGVVAVPAIIRPNQSPQTTNYQFQVPTIWIDPTNKLGWILVSKPQNDADWVMFGSGSGTLNTITTPDSVVVSPTAGNIDFLNGNGMNITGDAGTSSITFNSVGMGLQWTVITGSSQAMANNNGYIANNGAGVTFSLPISCTVGTLVAVTGISNGGWTITQSVGQQVRFGSQVTTSGVGGSLASTATGDTVFLLCTVANTNFNVICTIGNITYV